MVALAETPALATLLRLINAAGLAEVLRDASNITLFAPQNGAFVTYLRDKRLTEAQLVANPEALAQVLQYHVAIGEARRARWVGGRTMDTVYGLPLTLRRRVKTPNYLVEGVNQRGFVFLVGRELVTSNGCVVQPVDRIIEPPAAA